ncbi:hypothetical protein GOP47_0022932 [Adiantum capillus-veneris]|uniref:Uncharacterized protein n=1 Tax=Adiantum capillus-veneris TaxID=13818 RepID=A0A9D4Z4S0_ADICA|nr:hypothetical protein GOP47_0022932 [Adiantum capillus-veneris]
MALFRSFSIRRSTQRIRLATFVHSLSRLAPKDARRLFSKDVYPPWVVFPACEKVGWLNGEVAKVWPFLEQAASVPLVTWLESTLDSYKADNSVSFRIQKFMLGPVVPQIFDMEKIESRQGEITIEFDFQWTGNPRILLVVELPAVGATWPVQLRDIKVHGRMRLTFKPLFNEFPCFQAFMYSIKDLRDFQFSLKGEPGIASSVPGVFKTVEKSIKAAILDTLVWPMRRIVEIIPGPYRELEVQVSGILRVKVVEARNLLNKDIIGKSDPFTVLYIRPVPSRMKRSKTINNDLRPIWNETFKFEVEDLPTQSLFIKVLDDDGVQEAELLGCARFELKNLKPGQLKDLWIPLSRDFQFCPKSSNKYRGEIHLELCYVRSTKDLLTPLASLTTPRSPMSRQLTSLEKLFSTSKCIPPAINTLMSPSNMQETIVLRGLLSIMVLRADGLMKQKPIKELNPYVRLKMTKSQAVLRTRVIDNTCKPEWNTLFHIVVEDALHDMLILEVWNHRIFNERLIGKSAMTVTSLLQNNDKDIEVKLHEESTGKVLIHLEWKELSASDPQFCIIQSLSNKQVLHIKPSALSKASRTSRKHRCTFFCTYTRV